MEHINIIKTIANADVQDVYGLIADIEQYPNIFEYIDRIKILTEIKGQLIVEVNVKVLPFSFMFLHYSGIKFSYKCRVRFVPNSKIIIIGMEGPFKSFNAHWELEVIDECTTKLKYSMSYEPQSRLLLHILRFQIQKYIEKTIVSFETALRARQKSRRAVSK